MATKTFHYAGTSFLGTEITLRTADNLDWYKATLEKKGEADAFNMYKLPRGMNRPDALTWIFTKSQKAQFSDAEVAVFGEYKSAKLRLAKAAARKAANDAAGIVTKRGRPRKNPIVVPVAQVVAEPVVEVKKVAKKKTAPKTKVTVEGSKTTVEEVPVVVTKPGRAKKPVAKTEAVAVLEAQVDANLADMSDIPAGLLLASK